MGSSFHALHPLNLQLISHGFTALMVETSELVHYKSRFFGPKTLVVAVSQSGQSAEMVRLAEVNRKRSAVVAVTNTPQSPLVEHATAALFTQAGTRILGFMQDVCDCADGSEIPGRHSLSTRSQAKPT